MCIKQLQGYLSEVSNEKWLIFPGKKDILTIVSYDSHSIILDDIK